MIKRILSITTILAFIASLAFAASAPTSSVENYVSQLISDSITILEDEKLEDDKKIKKIKSTLEANLDMKWMAKFTLGRNVKILPKKDVNEFINAYSEYLLATYAKGLKEYKGQKVEIKSYDDLGNGFYIVKTNLIGHSDQPIHVDYLTRNVNGTYKVRDIITEGISLVNAQRSEYAGALENKGLQHLIGELKKRSVDKPSK